MKKPQNIKRSFLTAFWEDTVQRILTVLDIVGFLAIVLIVVDDGYELVAVLVFVGVGLWSNYTTFKKQQGRITQLEEELATEQKAISATVALLSEEMSQNLVTLSAFWEKVNQANSDYKTDRFLALGPPTISQKIWERQISLLAKGLSDEQLRQAQFFYDQLNKIKEAYSTLQSLYNEQQENLRAGKWQDGGTPQMGVPGPPSRFQQNAPVLWQGLEQIVTKLIEQGNPLRHTSSEKPAG
jgi:gas vesicle protein